MKTSRTPAVDRKSKRRDNRLVGGIIIGVAFFSASVFLGVQIERSHYETPLPANQACLKYADDVTNALIGSQSEIVSAVTDAKAQPVDVGAIRASRDLCRHTSDKYAIEVQK